MIKHESIRNTSIEDAVLEIEYNWKNQAAEYNAVRGLL